MMLLPGPKDACPICAVKHGPTEPHNCQSLYYQYRFYAVRHRWPTWADAIAHCPPHIQALWKTELKSRNAWTEPANGEPIADPPHDSINQMVGPIGTVTTITMDPEDNIDPEDD